MQQNADLLPAQENLGHVQGDSLSITKVVRLNEPSFVYIHDSEQAVIYLPIDLTADSK